MLLRLSILCGLAPVSHLALHLLAHFLIFRLTDDVGFGSLLTGNQTAGVTIVDVTECAVSWMTSLYSFGARNFIFQNMIPLQQVTLKSRHLFPFLMTNK